MTAIHVVGIGMTHFGRHPHLSLKQLTADAVGQALADAGATPSDVRAAYFSNTVQGALEGQLMVRGQIALRPLGFEGIPIFNVENACASASSAFALARAHLLAGLADVAIAVGVDKMVIPDKARMMGIFDGAWDVHDTDAGAARLLALGADAEVPLNAAEMAGRSFFMDVYAAFSRAHMAAFGTTREQIAYSAAKNHNHSVLNPLAQYQKPMTVEEVLAAPEVIWPLTIPMCAPVSDGAAAAILCTGAALSRFDKARSVRVLASEAVTGIARPADSFDRHLAALAAERAYATAGVGPPDMDLAEVHDATSFAEIQQVETLGFCAFGDGGPFITSGATTLGGRIPVNPSGGLVSKGHPIGATGLGQIWELVTQLRGEAGARQVQGARHAIAENGGGLYGIEEATATVTILAR